VEEMMNLDVLINSCARPDVLEISVNTFQKRIRTKHNLRYVLFEDKVKDSKRQSAGREWIEKNKYLFDDIIYSEVIMGPYGFWQPTVQQATTDYILHIEDDANFIEDLFIDGALEFMINNADVAEIIFRRDSTNPKNIGDYISPNGLDLTEFKMYSIASGIYNTSLLKKVLDIAGWDSKMHEAKVLLPAANKLNLRRYILGHGVVHYVHVGGKLHYVKGDWKN
jgi:hypothetical protein